MHAGIVERPLPRLHEAHAEALRCARPRRVGVCLWRLLHWRFCPNARDVPGGLELFSHVLGSHRLQCRTQ